MPADNITLKNVLGLQKLGCIEAIPFSKLQTLKKESFDKSSTLVSGNDSLDYTFPEFSSFCCLKGNSLTCSVKRKKSRKTLSLHNTSISQTYLRKDNDLKKERKRKKKNVGSIALSKRPNSAVSCINIEKSKTKKLAAQSIALHNTFNVSHRSFSKDSCSPPLNLPRPKIVRCNSKSLTLSQFIKKTQFTNRDLRPLKLYQSNAQTACVRDRGTTFLGCPPPTPRSDAFENVEFVKSFADVRSQMLVKSKLKDLIELMKREDIIRKQRKEVLKAEEDLKMENEKREYQRQLIYLLNNLAAKWEVEMYKDFCRKNSLSPHP